MQTRQTGLSRRSFLAGLMGMAGAALFPFDLLKAASPTYTIRMITSEDARHVHFAPIGLLVPVGSPVRWEIVRGFHSVTAYHPDNGNHELRIPEQATPWDSGVLTGEPGKDAFRYTFTVPGVYDYYCGPHEFAGMVGRIVVGTPGDGPGTRPFGWGGDQWQPVPEAAQKAFPSVERIVNEGRVT